MALFGREHGSKPGSAGVASAQQQNIDRRERLRQLALETIDLAKDPYFMKNHLGSYECKLCLTLHTNEGSYLAHTQGRRHQQNLARRAAREQREVGPTTLSSTPKPVVKRTPKIGRPGYKVIKERDADTNQLALQFEVHYPEIVSGIKPRYRFMSAFEQKNEVPDKSYQYLLFAAEPYETIAFKIPNKDIVKNVGPEVPGESPFWTKYDESGRLFNLHLTFKPQPKERTEREKSDYDPMAPRPDRDSGAANPRANYAYFNR
jgi:splicing factor 3A subunit 2